MEPWPTQGSFQTIFCRNVVIYMDQAAQERIWSGLIDLLDRRGVLSIGHSERLSPAQMDRVTLIGRTTGRVLEVVET